MSLFITLEGTEGVGKSSALAYIKSLLEQQETPFLVTREPGGTPIAETIRRTLLAQFEEPMHAKTELLLMCASRNQHVAQVIKPALEAGKVVVCDRYMDASYAYQGGGRALGALCVRELEDWLALNLPIDATLLLDAPVDVGFARLEQSRGSKDRIELEQRAFFERVRQAYLERAEAEPDRFHLIDAAQPLEAVQEQLSAALSRILSLN